MPFWIRRSLFLVFVLGAVSAVVLRYAGPGLIVAKAVAQPEAIVVLASHEWERLPAAAQLARLYPQASILLTVPPVANQYNCYDCAERVSWLGSLGVVRSRVTSLKIRGNGTHGEAEAVLRHCRGRGIRRLLVVTSPYHTRRALATFRRVLGELGIEVGVYPALAESGAVPAHWWLRSYDRDYVVYEWTALTYYAARFRIWPSLN